MARVTFEISEEGKNKLKAKAAAQGKTIRQVLTEFCEEFYGRHKEDDLDRMANCTCGKTPCECPF